MPDLVDGLLEALAGLHPSALYLLAGLFTALETAIGIGLLIPGDSVVLLAATTITTPYRFAALVAVTVLGSVTGESVGYLLGHRCGIRVRTSRLGRRLGEDRWVKAEVFLNGRGGRAVAAARFVAVVHALVPVVAGTVRMPYRRFVGWAVVGAVAWSVLYVGIGVAVGASWREYGNRLGLIGLAVGAVLVVVLVARATRRGSVPTARPPEGPGSGSRVGPRTPARSPNRSPVARANSLRRQGPRVLNPPATIRGDRRRPATSGSPPETPDLRMHRCTSGHVRVPTRRASPSSRPPSHPPRQRGETMTSTQTLRPRAAPESAGSPVIVARGLTKRYGRLTAVDNLSFEVGAGRVTGFVGPNGAGKSTTLRMLLGLVQPTDGDATVLGLPYRSLERPTTVVGAVLETHSFHPGRTGRNHLRMLAMAAGIRQARVDEVLEQVGLTSAAGRKVRTYSLGMRQRLGLAAALLGEPRVLILDEPANGLDPQGIRWLRELLRSFAQRGNAVLVSSHLLAEMGQLADEMIVVHRGRLVGQGTVAELAPGASLLRVASPQPDTLAEVLRADGMAVQRNGDGRLLVSHGSAERVGTLAAMTGIPLFGLADEQSTLEDVFLQLTDEERAR